MILLLADDIKASIIILDEKTGAEEYNIKSAFDNWHVLRSVETGDILNIKGLGRLKVLQSIEHYREHQFLGIIDVVITCKWVSDWWNTTTTAMITAMVDAYER